MQKLCIVWLSLVLSVAMGGCATSQVAQKAPGDSIQVKIEPQVKATYEKLVFSISYYASAKVLKPSTLTTVTLTFNEGTENEFSTNLAVNKIIPSQDTLKGLLNVERLITPISFELLENDGVRRFTVNAVFSLETNGQTTTYSTAGYGEYLQPVRPRITATASAARFEGKSYELTITINLENPNPFPLQMGSLDYKLVLGDAELQTGKLYENLKVSPGSIEKFDLNESISAASHAELLRTLSGQNSVPYLVQAIINIGSSSYPADINGTQLQ